MAHYTRSYIYHSETFQTDGTNTGNTFITNTFNPNAPGSVFVWYDVHVYIHEATNILTPALISVGYNSPNYNNIVSTQAVGGSLGLVKLLTVGTSGEIPHGETPTELYVKVNVAALGIPLTTPVLKFSILIEGVLLIEAAE